MVDQTIQFLEGIAKDIMVKIYDYYVPANFMILNMGEKKNTLDQDKFTSIPRIKDTMLFR
jgi:hypothetical protein